MCTIIINVLFALSTKSPYITESFTTFLETKIIPATTLFSKMILIMDNTKFYHAQKSLNMLNRNGFEY